MYWHIGNLFKLITRIFRLIQILGILYLIVFVAYWFCTVAELKFARIMSAYYTIPCDITSFLINKIGLTIDKRLALLHPEMFLAIITTFIFLILYNFIFIPLGYIEKFFVEKAYDKGERDYK